MLFTQRVVEVRHYVMEYTVEADSVEDAQRKAEVGDTTLEDELQCDGVIARETMDEPRQLEPAKESTRESFGTPLDVWGDEG